MKLNKNTSYVLIHLLNGANTAQEISKRMPTMNIRSIQRALVRLNEGGIIERHGITNPTYNLKYKNVISQKIDSKLLENIERPDSVFNFSLLAWFAGQDLIDVPVFGAANNQGNIDSEITKKELEHLTVELAWKSSALEGNTYTLLDTQLLIQEGVRAKNKTSFETQMILNHKEAMTFIVDNPSLFTQKITFKTVEELHRRIGFNLGIESGVRKHTVRISASNYKPVDSSYKIREYANSILDAIGKQEDPFRRALLALSWMPYLQPFEDGNKRTGRMLANAILIHSIGRGFSLRNIDAKQLALAYLAFYEFNSLVGLSDILENELS